MDPSTLPPIGEITIPVGIQDSAGAWHPIGSLTVPVTADVDRAHTANGSAEVPVVPDLTNFEASVSGLVNDPATVEWVAQLIERQHQRPNRHSEK